ncbi:MAG: cryptochrome/photolyase family protein, partial [Alphaproteobacteria bacterium]
AVARGEPVVGLYALNRPGADGARAPGAATRWKLHGALQDLRNALATLNIPLILRSGDIAETLDIVVRELEIAAVFWSRRYAPDAVAQDATVMAKLKAKGILAKSFNGKLLAEPWTVKTQAGGWFKVFTPFCRAARASHPGLRPLPAPGLAPPWENQPNLGDDLETWGLTPNSPAWSEPDWTGGLAARWPSGEGAAKARMSAFLEDGFKGYKDGRNLPWAPHVSGLSPYLATGELSPRQARQAALNASEEAGGALNADFETFERELYWRDFSYTLLFYGDDISAKNLQSKFDAFPWRDDEAAFKAWTKGETGYPIVDAGMRELWRTGYMHNRIRMITASFLTKHLLIDWRRGEQWFWATLVDADPASNPVNWQWVAGSGADAAPYFRIFNPMTQGEKFDPDGAYVRTWVPELSDMPDKYLHAPWIAPESVLKTAREALGVMYPRPIVDHKIARDRALAAYKKM